MIGGANVRRRADFLVIFCTTLTPSCQGSRTTPPDSGEKRRDALPQTNWLHLSTIRPARLSHERLKRTVAPSRRSLADLDLAHQAVRLTAHQVDRQEAVREIRGFHLDPVGQYERAAELARGDAAVNVFPGLVVFLLAADDELLVLERDLDLVALETGDRQRDPQQLGSRRGAFGGRDAFDVVGRIAVRALADAVDQAFHFVEAEQQRARQKRHS